MQKFDVLTDGPYRYIHSTKTGELLTTLEKLPQGRFVELNKDKPVYTLRHWKSVLSRRFEREFA